MAKSIDTDRRLVAIFAADVEGYSRLMGADEVGTLRDLTQRRAVLDGLIASHRGRIANTAGDSVLAEFGSAVDAVQCAVEAQAALAGANFSLSLNRQINFRIGVHVGDVMVKGGDLFGDAVNIAARLQTIASAGGTCISGAVYDQVRKVLPFAFTDLGAQQVKNIEEPVRAFSVSVKGAASVAGASKASMPLALPDKPSIAVLPFQNMSGDPEQEYFADGMVEDIITALSRFKSLFVIARNSSFTYKGKAVDVKKVGQELGVRYVLEGSVRKSGNRVRITGQLIDAESGTHIWADRFDGNLEDIFDLQDSVTSSTVGAIAPKLQQSEFERLKRKPTENLSAYDLYLRGLAKFYQFKKESLEEAIKLFDGAMALDPQFASPCAAEAFAIGARQTFGWGIASSVEKAKVNRLARRAAELDKDDAVALTYAGYALVLLCHELDDGAELLERATIANPNLAIAWTYRGYANMHLGRPEEAIEYFKNALRLSPLDPLDFATQKGLADVYFFAGQHAEALRWSLSAIRANPNWAPARLTAARSYALLGDVEAARAMAQIAVQMDPANRISSLRQRFPLRREQDYEKLLEAYRLAGLPE